MNNKAFTLNMVLMAALSLGGSLASCSSDADKKKIEELEKLAALDKKEMENDYAQYAVQYDELKKSIRDDSLLSKLNKEQQRAEALLEELRKTKSSDAVEITRLKKELATVRAVLRTYILQVDSLQQLNEHLQNENEKIRGQYDQANSQISNLTAEKQNLSDKVAIASQLDATGISLSAQNKRNKEVKKTKDIKRFVSSFTITRNTTAQTGNRTIYVRITKPNNEVVSQSGTCKFENTTVGYSAAKTIEYTGEEQSVTVYVPTSEFLSPGAYHVYIIVDGVTIGSKSISINK